MVFIHNTKIMLKKLRELNLNKLSYIQVLISNINYVVLYIFATLPAIGWLVVRYPAYYFPIDLSRFFALLAFGFLSSTILITIKRPLKLPYIQLRLLPNIDKLYIHHQILGILSLLSIYFHYLFLLIYYRNLPIFVNIIFFGDISSLNLGLISFYILTIGLFIIYFASKLKYKTWSLLHSLFSIFWIVSVLHIILVKSNYKNILSLKLIIYFYLIFITTIYIYRVILKLFLYKYFFTSGIISKIDKLTEDNYLITITAFSKNGFKNILPGHYVFLKLDKKHNSIIENPFTVIDKKDDDQIQFIIKKYENVTKKIIKSQNAKIYINGPFGTLPEEILSKRHPNIIIFTAGIGITPTIGILNLITKFKLKIKSSVFYITKNTHCDIFDLYFKNLNKKNTTLNCYKNTIYTEKSGRPTDQIYNQFLKENISKVATKNLIIINGPYHFINSVKTSISHEIKNLKNELKLYTENIAFNKPMLLTRISIILIFITIINTLIRFLIF